MSERAGQIETVRDLRRSQIVAEARGLISEAGLRALTFGALEKRLSFSRGVITYHFKNKDEIVDAVLESAIVEIDTATAASVQRGQTFAEKVHAVIYWTVKGFIDHREAGHVLIAFWSQLPRDDHATRVNARLYERYRRSSAALIRAGQQMNAFRQDVDVDAMAAHFVGTVIGVVTQSYFDADAIDWEAAVEEAVASLVARLVAPPQ